LAPPQITTQLPPLQVRPELHWFPPQQVWLAAPQTTQLPPLHVRPEPLQALLAQQGCPDAPHCWQVPLEPLQIRLEVHCAPAQQG